MRIAIADDYGGFTLELHLTADCVEDIPIPGAPYTIGTFKRTKALGDLEVLQKHGWQMGCGPLYSDINRGLAILKKSPEACLAV